MVAEGNPSPPGGRSSSDRARTESADQPTSFGYLVHSGGRFLDMKSTIVRGVAAVAVAGVAFLSAACSSSDQGASQNTTTSMAPPATSQPMTNSSSATADPAADLVGPGCADYAKAVPSGAGSVSGMAEDPVAV